MKSLNKYNNSNVYLIHLTAAFVLLLRSIFYNYNENAKLQCSSFYLSFVLSSIYVICMLNPLKLSHISASLCSALVCMALLLAK